MPKVSVIIPAYNSARFIGRTIESVRKQTFKDWELIVVDDGSIDDTREIVSLLHTEDPRIVYIYQDNSGAPANPKNNALKIAQGELIAFLDHDDEWLPQKLEKNIRYFERGDTDFLASGAIIYDENNESQEEHTMPRIENVTGALLERNFIFCSSGVVCKREIFSKIGYFDEKFRYGDDWDMWLRISLAHKINFLYEPLYIFNRHTGTVTSNIKFTARIADYDYGLAKHLEVFKKHPKEMSSRLVTQGRICYSAGEKRRGVTFFARAVKVYPLNWKAYINLFFALMGPAVYGWFISIRNKNAKK